MERTAPDEIRADVATLLGTARAGAASGDPATLAASELGQADAAIDQYARAVVFGVGQDHEVGRATPRHCGRGRHGLSALAAGMIRSWTLSWVVTSRVSWSASTTTPTPMSERSRAASSAVDRPDRERPAARGCGGHGRRHARQPGARSAPGRR